MEGAQLDGQLVQFGGVLAQTRPLEGGSGRRKCTQFLRRDRDKAAKPARLQPPVLLAVAALHLLQRPERLVYGIPHPLRSLAADVEVRLDVGKGHAEMRALETNCQTDDLRYSFVPHAATLPQCLAHPAGSTIGNAPGGAKPQARKPTTCGRPGFASHSSRSISASAPGSPRRSRISALRRTTAKSPGVSAARSRMHAGGSSPK